jgi:hypothetical protein
LITGFSSRKCAIQPSATRYIFAAAQHDAVVAGGRQLWKEEQEKTFDYNDSTHSVRMPGKAFASLCL